MSEEAAPPAPAMPSLKLSQIVPMVLMLGMGKIDMDELGYRRHVEVAYVIAQVLCLLLVGYIYQKVEAMEDDSKKIHIPEVTQFGQVVSPATDLTAKEYDQTKIKEQLKQSLMGAVILGGVYYKWQYLIPLLLQIIMTPLQLYESPLFQLHVLKKPVSRPFPAPNPLGLPTTPETPAAPAEEKKEVKDGEKESKKKA